jgi:hypothetical protein
LKMKQGSPAESQSRPTSAGPFFVRIVAIPRQRPWKTSCGASSTRSAEVGLVGIAQLELPESMPCLLEQVVGVGYCLAHRASRAFRGARPSAAGLPFPLATSFRLSRARR